MSFLVKSGASKSGIQVGLVGTSFQCHLPQWNGECRPEAATADDLLFSLAIRLVEEYRGRPLLTPVPRVEIPLQRFKGVLPLPDDKNHDPQWQPSASSQPTRLNCYLERIAAPNSIRAWPSYSRMTIWIGWQCSNKRLVMAHPSIRCICSGRAHFHPKIRYRKL